MFISININLQEHSDSILDTKDSWRGLRAPHRCRGQPSTGPVSASEEAEHSNTAVSVRYAVIHHVTSIRLDHMLLTPPWNTAL